MSLQHLYKETIQWILDPIINATVIFQDILHTEFYEDTKFKKPPPRYYKLRVAHHVHTLFLVASSSFYQ